MAALGAPRPRRSWRNENCSPTRVASSTRCCRRAVAVSTNSLLARTSPAPDAWLRAHQNVGSHDFCRCAHGQRVEEKGNNQVQTLRLNHGTTDSHPTQEHSESIFSESRSSQRTLTRLPKVTTESYPM